MESDSFENLPNEMIEMICENMDSKTLKNYVRVSKKINNICSRIMIERNIENQVEKLLKGKYKCSYLILPTIDVVVIFGNNYENGFQIEQLIMSNSPNDYKEISWVIPNELPNYETGMSRVGGDKHLLTNRFKHLKQVYNRVSIHVTPEKLPEIIELMISLGYSSVTDC